MLVITPVPGVKFTFENGWTVSITMGPDSYAENYEMLPRKCSKVDTAEVAVFSPKRQYVPLGHIFRKYSKHDDVHGYLSADEIVEIMQAVRRLKANWDNF
jgi:hypothetical protein